MRRWGNRAWQWVIAAGTLTLVGSVATALAAGLSPQSSTSLQPVEKLDPVTARRGAEIYATVCSACHEQGLNRAPQRAMLQLMTPESIDLALTQGVMRPQGAGLTAADKRMIAEYLAGRPIGAEVKGPLRCKAGASPFDIREPPPFAGWGLTPESSHAIPTHVAGIDRSNVGRLELKWSLAFPNAIRARSQPAIAGGAIFVGSHDGTVFALDRRTG